VLGLVAVILLRVAPGPQDLSFERYRELVTDYQNGRREAAVATLREWAPSSAQRRAHQLAELVRGGQEGLALARAATMLHTDCALVEPDKARLLDHLQLASQEADALRERGHTSYDSSWYLAIGLWLLSRGDALDAEKWLERSRERYRRNAPVLLALGSVYEALSRGKQKSPPPGAIADATGERLRDALLEVQDRRALLEKAAATFGRGLEIDPLSEDLHLRLGMVLYALGRPAEAVAKEVDWGLSRGRRPDVLYLIHLLAGRIEGERQRWIDATEHFRAAGQLCPGSQTARLALSEALYKLGDPSAEVGLQAALAPASSVPDPWWNYLLGGSERAEEQLKELRAAVQ
jgi:tetratricopeptide (TPR) repeat protein